MEATFRFRRQNCRPLWDATVRLFGAPAETFSVSADQVVADALPPESLQAVLLGVTGAYSSIAGARPLSISVVGVTDHSGTTSQIAFKACAEGATYHLLGFSDLAPPSGIPAEA